MTDLEKTRIRMEMDEELKEYRKLSKVHRGGRRWLKEVRQALGMSVTEIAHRLGCARSLVYRIEEAEGRGADRIDTLQEMARAMNCELIYAIVPRYGKTLEKTAEDLREYPRWRTPKQEERRKKASEEQDKRFCAEH